MADLSTETIQAKTQLVRTMRIVTAISLFLVFIYARFILLIPFPLIYGLVGCFIVIFYSGLFAVLENTIRPISILLFQVFAAIRAVLDLSMVGIFVYLSGGILSPLTLFFFLPAIGCVIVVSNLILNLFIALFGAIVYILVLALPIYGIIPSPPELVSFLGIRFILTDISLLALLLFLFAFSVSYLVSLLEKREYAALDAKVNYNKIREELLRGAKESEEKNRSMVDRELEMVKLKQKINGLLAELGRPGKY